MRTATILMIVGTAKIFFSHISAWRVGSATIPIVFGDARIVTLACFPSQVSCALILSIVQNVIRCFLPLTHGGVVTRHFSLIVETAPSVLCVGILGTNNTALRTCSTPKKNTKSDEHRSLLPIGQSIFDVLINLKVSCSQKHSGKGVKLSIAKRAPGLILPT